MTARPDRDCMAPDTEPTDEELAIVMHEAGELARARKAQGDAWLAEQIAQAFEAAGLTAGAALARTGR
jgi:uncharacterized protein YggL (DUF469 family)